MSQRYHGWGLLACVLCLLPGCGGRSTLVEGDADAEGDVAVDGGGDAEHPPAEVSGLVRVFRRQQVPGLGDPFSLHLMAYVYEGDFDRLAAVAEHEVVERVATPDGVPCAIYYHSGMFPDPEDVMEEPPQINGGPITAGVDPDAGLLTVQFDGDAYTVDYRWTGGVLPGWAELDTTEIVVRGAGHGVVAPFVQEIIVAGWPAFESPMGGLDDPLLPDESGNFRVAWTTASATDDITVSFDFNLDWDYCLFICSPPPGPGSLLIPQDWIQGWTWGSGYVRVVARHLAVLRVAGTEIQVQTSSITEDFARFGE